MDEEDERMPACANKECTSVAFCIEYEQCLILQGSAFREGYMAGRVMGYKSGARSASGKAHCDGYDKGLKEGLEKGKQEGMAKARARYGDYLITWLTGHKEEAETRAEMLEDMLKKAQKAFFPGS